MPISMSNEELSVLYESGLGLRRLSRLAGCSKSGLRKRLAKIGVMQDRSPKRRDRGNCPKCGTPLRIGQAQFCSHSCRASITNIGKTRCGTPGRFQAKPCATCDTEHKNPKYCSSVCSAIGSKKPVEETAASRRLRTLIAVRRYQAKKFMQTPPDADHEKIKEIYAACPEGHEVDHIIPISRGGRHHQDNLQYLSISDNRRKSNKLNWTSDPSGKGISLLS